MLERRGLPRTEARTLPWDQFGVQMEVVNRLSRNLYFVDESGQFFPRQGELGTAAILLVPDEPAEVALVHELAGEWRKNFTRDGKIKSAFIPDDEKIRFAHLVVSRQWWVGIEPAQMGEELDRDVKTALLDTIRTTRTALPFAQRSDVTIDFLMHQVESLSRDKLCWYMVQNTLLGKLCEIGRIEGHCPVGEFVLDNKLPLSAVELAAFMVRVRIAVEFPEVFREHIATVLGVSDRRPLIEVRISTEQRDDGLVLADVCAAELGRVVREGEAAPNSAKRFRDVLAGRK